MSVLECYGGVLWESKKGTKMEVTIFAGIRYWGFLPKPPKSPVETFQSFSKSLTTSSRADAVNVGVFQQSLVHSDFRLAKLIGYASIVFMKYRR
jgi:hypothetical protein